MQTPEVFSAEQTGTIIKTCRGIHNEYRDQEWDDDNPGTVRIDVDGITVEIGASGHDYPDNLIATIEVGDDVTVGDEYDALNELRWAMEAASVGVVKTVHPGSSNHAYEIRFEERTRECTRCENRTPTKDLTFLLHKDGEGHYCDFCAEQVEPPEQPA